MSKALVRIRRRRDSFERLMRMSDTELRILNSNASKTPESDTLFKVLRSKGDAGNMAKIFSRLMTESEYLSLIKDNKREWITILAKEKGIYRERKGAPSKPADEPVKSGSIIKAQREARSIARAMRGLSRRGWTSSQISDTLVQCTALGLPSTKMSALFKNKIPPEQARLFLMAHVDMAGIGYASARSHRNLSFKVLGQIGRIMQDSPRMTEELLEFCAENAAMLSIIKDSMQKGNRGRVGDTMDVMGEMLRLYRVMHSCAEDFSDLHFLEMLCSEPGHDGDDDPPRPIDDRPYNEQRFLESAIEAREDLVFYNIELIEEEQRLTVDQGNFNPTKRRRRGGF